MPSLNKVMLIGNLTRDPELRVTPKGTSICQFSLAVNRQFKGDDGTPKDETTFVDIEAWGKQADLVAKYLSKGSPCYVEGRLRLDQWDDKTTGQKRSRLRVVLENVQFLGSGKGQTSGVRSGDDQGESRSYDSGVPMQRSNPPPAAQQNDEDVPF